MTKDPALARESGGERATGTHRWLALGGLVGPVVFVLVFTVAGLVRPGYSPIDQPVSDLGIGENDWILNASLIFVGLALIGCAFSLYRSVRLPGGFVIRAAGLSLVAGVGAGFAAAGILPETSPLHWLIGAPLAFLGSILGFVLTGILLRRNPQWRGWGTLTLLAGLATTVLIVLMFSVFSSYRDTGGPSPVGQNGGLIERIVFIEIMAWYALTGWRLYRHPITNP